MMHKYFNTELINTGMPEEIREHFMGHVINNKVRDAYFLAEPEELLKVYLKYMDSFTIENVKVTSDKLRSDNNAKINELESLVREMKKKLDKVTDSV